MDMCWFVSSPKRIAAIWFASSVYRGYSNVNKDNMVFQKVLFIPFVMFCIQTSTVIHETGPHFETLQPGQARNLSLSFIAEVNVPLSVVPFPSIKKTF